MTPVGGSRHYTGGGLGEIGIWGCPSCGEDNTGPLAEGCVHCGAGKPGNRPAAVMPPSPPPAPPEPLDSIGQGDVADHWAAEHPEATVTDAYRAGYLDGVQAARAASRAATPVPVDHPNKDVRIARTMIAALSFFRDQILIGRPEEVETGEWLSAEDATAVITDIKATMLPPDEVPQ